MVLAAADVTVLAGPALAATGAESDGGLALAVLLLALGALGMWWRRRAVSAAR